MRSRGPPPGRRLPTDFNAFLRIGEDGRVTCFTGKIEMGQGPITSLPQMLAEELDTPLDSVDIVMGDTELCPWDMGTFGSMTTRLFGPALQAAAAEARAVLLELAAEALKVPQAQLAAKDGAIFDQAKPGAPVHLRPVGEGAEDRAAPQGQAGLEGRFPNSRWSASLCCAAMAGTKSPAKPNTRATSACRDMLYAKILRPPAHGAKLKSVDTAPAKAVAGMQVVQEGDLVAVLHELPDVAEAALEKIKAEFDVPETDGGRQDHLRPPAQMRRRRASWPRRRPRRRQEAGR